MLLTTKLFTPRRQPHLIARPRLHEALNAGLQGKVILVSAPPGFGKTTLLVDWLTDLGFGILDFGLPTSADDPSSRPEGGGDWVRQNPKSKIENRKSAWLSLDEQDNDPVRFLTYLLAALQTVAPAVGRSWQGLLDATQPPALNDALTMLLNDLAGVAHPFVLVLDDYHLIQHTLIHQAVAFLVEQMPPAMRLVITSRTDPPLPLARWRVKRELSEVREHHLRFTLAETADFLHQTLQIDLSTRDLHALEQRTEGWITSLQLVALSLTGRANPHQFVAALTGSHAYIIDYLTEEVLQRQPPAVQEFLLHTAILNRLNAALCAWVIHETTRSGEAQVMLEQLERNRLFVTALDNERKWYRYHHLFADVLRIRLRQTAPGLVSQLHGRASRWFADQRLYAEAIYHAIQAHDFARAAAIIEEQANTSTKQGEYHTVATWVEQLPPEVVSQRPRLGLDWALHKVMHHEPDAAEAALQLVAATIQTTQTDLLGEYHTIRATIASKRNQFDQAETLAHGAWTLLPPTNNLLRARLLNILGVAAYYRDDHERSLHLFAETGRLALAAGDLNTALNGLANEALVLCLRGALRRAAAAFQRILELASAYGAEQVASITMVHGHLADLLFERNDLATMRHHLDLTHASLVYGNLPSLEIQYQICLAKLRQAEGNRGEALAAIQQASAIADAHHMPSSNRGEVVACQVRLWLAYGNLDDAITWANQSGLSPDDEIATVREPEYIALARVLIAQGAASQALLLLARLHKAAEAVGRCWVQIELLALQAVAHAGRGNRPAAHETLVQALRLGVSEGYIRSFVLAGDALHTLLLAAHWQLGEAHLRQYAVTILAAFPPANTPASVEQHDVAQRDEMAQRDVIAPLSERELEVLRLVAAGYSDREIADQLVVVVGTAKRHLNNIYGKLLVHSRTQALVRARELGLLA